MHGDAGVCKALRADNDMELCGCMVCHLFGEINPGEGLTEETGGRASRLIVACAAAQFPKNRSPRVRDGVGIDRQSRAAARADAVKFDLEVLPRGVKFNLRLELEDGSEADERLLAATLAEWEAGRAWLGGRVARGLGAFDLCHVKMVERDVTTDAGLLDFLRSDKPWKEASHSNAIWLDTRLAEARESLQTAGGAPCHEGVARSFVTVEFDLRLDGLFLTNDTTAATRSGFDHAPLLEVADQHGEPILPGSGLRGVLRSQAERIARTATTLGITSDEDFLKQCPACDPIQSNPAKALANCDSLLRTKAGVDDDVEVTDGQLCLACRLFGSTRRGGRLLVEDAGTVAATKRKPLDFLAIDRFTGGGKDTAKFDALALWKPIFRIRLHAENPAAWELGWLALVLRDLAQDMISVGFGAAKGFGRAKFDALTVHYCFIGDDDFEGPATVAQQTPDPTSGLYRVMTFTTQDAAQIAQMKELAQLWVDDFNSVRSTYTREHMLQAETDTFFVNDIPALYEKEAYRWLLNP